MRRKKIDHLLIIACTQSVKETKTMADVVLVAIRRRVLWTADADKHLFGPGWISYVLLLFLILYSGIDIICVQEPDSWTTQLKGCCVFPGRVKNRACVLERIEDARHHLRPGDVLIVKSVDVAWSPYFPIISGLVTEIGGIISHGTRWEKNSINTPSRKLNTVIINNIRN